MEYSTADLYWEDSKSNWYKAQHEEISYYFHNDRVSCWKKSQQYWTRTFFDAKKRVYDLEWRKVDEKFVRNNIKLNHDPQKWRGKMEYPSISECEFGNQATHYHSSLGKGDKKRFTMLMDDDLYDEVIADCNIKKMRRNTFINGLIKNVYDSREAA